MPQNTAISPFDLLSPCSLCELRCQAARLDCEVGPCGAGLEPVVYSRMLHFGEELELIPSYVLNLAGCSMACTFCSEENHLKPPFAGESMSPEEWALTLKKTLEHSKPAAKTLNFVGGEPSIHLPFLLQLLEHLDELWPAHPRALLNTNLYLTPQALQCCRGPFAIVLADHKFGDDHCARTIARTPRYLEVIQRNLLEVSRWPETQLVVRHLVMPGHLECCTEPVLNWLSSELAGAPNLLVNLMTGFVPFQETTASQRWHRLDTAEAQHAKTLFNSLRVNRKLWNGGPPVA